MSHALLQTSSVRISLDQICRRLSPESFPAAVALGNISCEVYPGGRVALATSHLSAPLPLRAGALAGRSYEARRLYLHAINDVLVFGSGTFFTDRERRVVTESVAHWGGQDLDGEDLLGALRKRTRATYRDKSIDAHLAGVSLFARSGFEDNPFHWHHDILPLVVFAQELLPEEAFRVLIGGGGDFMVKSLLALGIPRDRIEIMKPGQAVSIERMICMSVEQITAAPFPAVLHPSVGNIFASIKRGLLPEHVLPDRKVFVSRGRSERRLLLNRAAVEAGFSALGFHVVDPGTLPYEAQIALFHSLKSWWGSTAVG